VRAVDVDRLQKVLLLYQINFILDAVVNYDLYDLAGMIPMVQ